MTHRQHAPVKLVIAASLVIAGLIAIAFGIKNVSNAIQFISSPLDRAAASSSEEGDIANEELSVSDTEFLPVYIPLNDLEPKKAPEIISDSTPESPQIPDESIPQLIPERLIIESIGVDASVVPIGEREVEYLGETYRQWNAPRSSDLGWHNTSALLGSPGNTVINGHSNGYGDAFKDLADLKNGDIIELHAEIFRYTYAVANVLILKERWEPIEIRMENAQWINSSEDERLTLISCWPNNSSTHRLIVVAIPIGVDRVDQEIGQDS